jgi:fluoroacetyl-CoA thioesterase
VTNELHPGMVGESRSVVTDEMTAATMRSGDVPVFATPAMVALMEEAAVRAIAPALEDGKTSVGVRVDVRHLAATPVGTPVRAQARLTLIEGRRLTFKVQAWDGSEQIGEGIHERMIVEREKFLQRTRNKT